MDPELGIDPPPPLDDEDRAFRESLDKLVDWVRVERRHVFLRAFAPALLLVPTGGSLVAWSFAPALGRYTLSTLLAGLLLIGLGPLWVLFTLVRSMGQDAYVAIRVDGLAVRLAPPEPERVLSWDAIDDAREEAHEPAVALLLTSGERLLLRGPFAGVSREELARRIRDARRLAVWHRLTPARLRLAR